MVSISYKAPGIKPSGTTTASMPPISFILFPSTCVISSGKGHPHQNVRVVRIWRFAYPPCASHSSSYGVFDFDQSISCSVGMFCSPQASRMRSLTLAFEQSIGFKSVSSTDIVAISPFSPYNGKLISQEPSILRESKTHPCIPL